MNRAPIGFRIRSRRKTLGLTQAELAKRAGISPSYLNLIEANKREIAGALLNKIAALLNLDTDTLTGRAERRLMADLREIALEPLIQNIGLAAETVGELVGRHPEWARALVTFYRAWRDQSAIADTLLNRLNQDPELGKALHQMLSHVTAIRSSSEILDDAPELDDVSRRRFQNVILTESQRLSESVPSFAGLFDPSNTVCQAVTPAEEADDFIRQHNAWFPGLETAGEGLRRTLLQSGGLDERALVEYLRSTRKITVIDRPSDGIGAGAVRNLMRYDPETRTVTVLANAPRSTRVFQLARQIACFDAGDAIETLVSDPLLSSEAARARARHALSSYVAGAILLPYGAFLTAVGECRYDIDRLAQRFDASYEQVCHRLITLRDPERSGVPFSFFRTDPAGFITKRFPLPRMPLPRHGHACPLWAVFDAYQTPGRTCRRLVEFPDGSRYLMIARAVTKPPPSFHQAPVVKSIMVTFELRHADGIIYADGLDLSSRRALIPVGPSCRSCPRADCRFRNEERSVEFAMATP